MYTSICNICGVAVAVIFRHIIILTTFCDIRFSFKRMGLMYDYSSQSWSRDHYWKFEILVFSFKIFCFSFFACICKIRNFKYEFFFRSSKIKEKKNQLSGRFRWHWLRHLYRNHKILAIRHLTLSSRKWLKLMNAFCFGFKWQKWGTLNFDFFFVVKYVIG